MKPRAKRNPNASLPKRLARFFWEYDLGSLSWRSDKDLIIAKVLSVGDWTSQQWLRAKLGDDALRKWIEQHQGRGLDPRSLRFWQLVLSIDARKVDKWIQVKLQNPWYSRLHTR